MTEPDLTAVLDEVEDEIERARARVLPGVGMALAVLALLALGLAWHVRLTDYGPNILTGWQAAAVVAPVCAVLTAIALAFVWRQPDRPGLPGGLAAFFALVGAIASLAGGVGADAPVSAGPGPWLATFALVTAGMLAVRAATADVGSAPTIGENERGRVAARVRSALRD